MARRDRRQTEEEPAEKFLDVDAAMQGTLSFKDPVNLRINGRFEGSLDTKGVLIVGGNATVSANITGESISIAGQVTGDIVATKELKLEPTGRLFGNAKTPVLSVAAGAILNGNCQMTEGGAPKGSMNLEEVARYLEVEPARVEGWAAKGDLPGRREGEGWRFEREKVEAWLARQK